MQHGVSLEYSICLTGTGLCGVAVVGNLAAISSNLSLPFLGARLPNLMKRIQASPVFLSVATILQPAKEACLLNVEHQDWMPRCGSTCKLPRMDVHSGSLLFLLSPCLWAYMIVFVSFLDYMCISPITVVVHESFSQFLMRIFPNVDVFLMCLLGVVSSNSS